MVGPQKAMKTGMENRYSRTTCKWEDWKVLKASKATTTANIKGMVPSVTKYFYLVTVVLKLPRKGLISAEDQLYSFCMLKQPILTYSLRLCKNSHQSQVM